MESNINQNHKNVAATVHLSTFAKYFFPFGNFLLPLIIWTTNKEKQFVEEHGREAINFQLSILIYSLAIGVICIPFFIVFATDFVDLVDTIDHYSHRVTYTDLKNLSGYIILFFVAIIFLLGLFVFELYAVISATIHAHQGKLYKYPLSIPFIKTSAVAEIKNQSENEHVS